MIELLKGYAIALTIGGSLVIIYCGLVLKGMIETARHPNPVERCVHGYDREHIIDGTIAIDTGPWSDVPRIGFDRCPGPGAGIGDNDV